MLRSHSSSLRPLFHLSSTFPPCVEQMFNIAQTPQVGEGVHLNTVGDPKNHWSDPQITSMCPKAILLQSGSSVQGLQPAVTPGPLSSHYSPPPSPHLPPPSRTCSLWVALALTVTSLTLFICILHIFVSTASLIQALLSTHTVHNRVHSFTYSFYLRSRDFTYCLLTVPPKLISQ